MVVLFSFQEICSFFTRTDELIKLHKSLVSTISELDLALAGTLKDVSNVLSDQRGFAFALKAFQKNLLWSLESLNTQTQSYCIELAQRMESTTKSVLVKLSLAVQDTVQDTEWQLAGLRSVSLGLGIPPHNKSDLSSFLEYPKV